MLTLIILFNSFKNNLCLGFGDELGKNSKSDLKLPEKYRELDSVPEFKKVVPIVIEEKKIVPIIPELKKIDENNHVKKQELTTDQTEKIDPKKILDDQKKDVMLDIKSDLDSLSGTVKTEYQKKFESISQTSTATVDQLKSFREDVRLIRVTGKIKDDFKQGDQLKIDLTKKPKENFFLSNLPESVVSINYNGEVYTRSVLSRKGEFIHVNEDNTFNILKPSDKMELNLLEVVSKEDISKKLKSENEKLESYKTVIDKAVILKIRERGLNEKILLEKVKDDLLSDEEERISDNIDDLKGEEKTKKQEQLDKFMIDKYPGFPSNLTKLNEKIDDYLDDYRFEKGAYYVPKKVLEKVSEIKDEKEKKEKVMEILKPQVDLAVRTYPTTWTKNNKVTTENPELTEMKNNPIFQLVNYLFNGLLGIDLFEEMGKEYNENYNSPEGAKNAIGNLIGGEGSDELGSLSEHFESGGKGSTCINPNDNGKPSFGTYQLRAEKVGMFVNHLKEIKTKNGKTYDIKGNYNQVGKNTEFYNNWISVVTEYEKDNGKGSFKTLEHNFIKKTHYDPQMNKISRETFYVDPSMFSMSLKNVIWSCSVQHGANNDVVVDAIKNLGKKLDYSDLNNQRKLIEEIYKVRTNKFSSQRSRYQKEKSIALQNLSINLTSNDSEIKVPRGIVSFPAERSKEGTTLCSGTARKNLSQIFGIQGREGSSAMDACNSYKNSGELKKDFTSSSSNVADIFMSSIKYPQYGHRAVAFRDNGSWYILDPYLRVIGGKATKNPIPWETYKSYLDKEGREFYGAKTY